VRVRLTPAAESDLRDIHTWYQTQAGDLASQFKRVLGDCLERIGKNPAAYPKLHGEIRRALLRQFPYCVFYMIGESEVAVLGVFHGHRDPKIWQSRSNV
jgi:plasmid stabilization system protein ParE